MPAFTVHTTSGSDPEGIPAPECATVEHHRRLVRAWRGLGDTHAMAYCGGCEWFLRWPLRDAGLARLRAVGRQHLGSAHLSSLVDGEAVFDADLTDGGDVYLRRRVADAIAATRPAQHLAAVGS